MQGPTKVVAAALYEHPHGKELRVYFEPEDRDDVLQTEVRHSADVDALEARAAALRDILRSKGWWELKDA